MEQGTVFYGGGLPADEGAKLDFKIDIGAPPCSTGFIPAPQIRTPADTTLRDLPTDLYCKTAQKLHNALPTSPRCKPVPTLS